MKGPPAIGFQCRPSKTLVAATIVVSLLAIAAAWLTRGPAWLHAVLTAVIAAGCGFSLARQFRPRVRALLWRADGGVELTLGLPAGNQREVQGELRSARILGPLIVLTLRWPPRTGTSLWLLPDNLAADPRRRMRMRLGAAPDTIASGNTDSG